MKEEGQLDYLKDIYDVCEIEIDGDMKDMQRS
jgi:hypothetical protein